MTQLEMLSLRPNLRMEQALARRDDPGTSKEAAKKVDVERLQRRVLEVLGSHEVYSPGDGLTCGEIAEILGTPRDHISPRMKGLELLGKVQRNGTRKVAGGRSQTVWKLTSK